MPRGRKKKNITQAAVPPVVPPVVSSIVPPVVPSTVPQVTTEKRRGRPVSEATTQAKAVGRCDRCGKPILTAQPYTIDTTRLTALAEWHREAMPNRVNLCLVCAHELSEVIEKWYFLEEHAKKKGYIERHGRITELTKNVENAVDNVDNKGESNG